MKTKLNRYLLSLISLQFIVFGCERRFWEFEDTKRSSIFKSDKQYYEEGEIEAKKDFNAGNYKIKRYGMVSSSGDSINRELSLTETHKQFLKNNYNVDIDVVAGCVVSPDVVNNVKGYNETMKSLLKIKYKTDIFDEAEINEMLNSYEITLGRKYTAEERAREFKEIKEGRKSIEKKRFQPDAFR